MGHLRHLDGSALLLRYGSVIHTPTLDAHISRGNNSSIDKETHKEASLLLALSCSCSLSCVRSSCRGRSRPSTHHARNHNHNPERRAEPPSLVPPTSSQGTTFELWNKLWITSSSVGAVHSLGSNHEVDEISKTAESTSASSFSLASGTRSDGRPRRFPAFAHIALTLLRQT